MLKRLIGSILLFILSTAIVYAAPQTLYDFIGTGSPSLTLTLSKNGPNWNSYSINYQSSGSVPWSTDPSANWSSWNVTDENQNYYGTVTLLSDSTSVTYGSYSPPLPANGYSLNGLNISLNNNLSSYQITASQVITPGPFPNTPLATPAVYPRSNTPIILSTNGNKIVNNKGQKIILKGLVRPSLEWSTQGQNLSPLDIQNIHKWGANVIRIDLNQNYWFASGPVTQNGSYKQIIDAIIYNATQNNMAVILDLHWTEDGHQSPMANQDSLKFWTQVASYYKNFGTVIFELFNEPNVIDTNTWLKGNGTYAGFQQLYDAVRSTGATNLVIVNGLDYAYDLSFVNNSFGVKGTNIIYGSHPYDQKGQPGYTGPGGTFAANYQNIINNYPIMFTEFGVNTPDYFPNGYQTIYANDLSFINQNAINYTGFAWWVDSSKPNTFPDLIQDWSGTPVNGGVLIQKDMQQHAGTVLNLKLR